MGSKDKETRTEIVELRNENRDDDLKVKNQKDREETERGKASSLALEKESRRLLLVQEELTEQEPTLEKLEVKNVNVVDRQAKLQRGRGGDSGEEIPQHGSFDGETYAVAPLPAFGWRGKARDQGGGLCSGTEERDNRWDDRTT